MIKKHVGHFIAEWRLYRELTQAELAAEVGVSQSNINQIEHGKTAYTQQSLEKIARALRTHPADLIATDPLRPAEEDDGSPFLDEVHSLLTSLSPLSRKLVRDFLKLLLQYERTDARIREGKLSALMTRTKLSEDFRMPPS